MKDWVLFDKFAPLPSEETLRRIEKHLPLWTPRPEPKPELITPYWFRRPTKKKFKKRGPRTSIKPIKKVVFVFAEAPYDRDTRDYKTENHCMIDIDPLFEEAMNESL